MRQERNKPNIPNAVYLTQVKSIVFLQNGDAVVTRVITEGEYKGRKLYYTVKAGADE